MDNIFKIKLVDSLEKVFADQEPRQATEKITAVRGETVSFQTALYFDAEKYHRGRVVVKTDLTYRMRKVTQVPSMYPVADSRDGMYLRTAPGLYPDLLEEIPDGWIALRYHTWQSIWIDLIIDADTAAGIFNIDVEVYDDEEVFLGEVHTEVDVMDAELPRLPIIHTEWFYADCIADYYKTEVFSERHWKQIEEFMKVYALRRCNMILTPIFTPALDTYIGGERTTVQLVKIIQKGEEYSFDYSNLERWVSLAQKCGIEYFEISHLFTQWGIKAAPKIVAEVDGVEKRIFGWDTPATGGTYEAFLRVFLPSLVEELKQLKIAERCYFHISDEPRRHMLEDYQKAKDVVQPYLKGFHRMDAISDYYLYELGLVETPVCGSNHIEPFLEKKVPNLWSYYCCTQGYKVSNRFMSMPSYRNRIYGIQLYLYEIKGILHWGFNFYNSVKSRRHINPYRVTDCDGGMPSGDSFLVYPGEGDIPEESIRIMVIDEAMADVCALYALEYKIGREAVTAIIDEEAGMKITFEEYPRNPEFLIRLRNRINRLL